MRGKGGQSTIQNKVFPSSFIYREEEKFKTLLKFVFENISLEHLHTKKYIPENQSPLLQDLCSKIHYDTD